MDKVYLAYRESLLKAAPRMMEELGIDTGEDFLGMGVFRKDVDLSNEEKQYLLSVTFNSVVNEEETVQHRAEFLNSIELSGLPPHQLNIKVGVPDMLLRSLQPPKLMSDTKCIVINCQRNIIEVEIVTGA
ncbi:hypothetical protein ElyMa_001162100 [Elysia marginata]|uniref:DNA helicase Pif1-like 2B domain-containing protein n=1 Tax=Elysia marginata TaxID=1093978 RepID=A0AAV4I4P0_9GAST|nr:hypothetical protein ElyMa_001162100 [Elysia marginata]